MFGVGSFLKNRLIMVVPVAMLAATLACSSGSATEAPAKQPEKTEEAEPTEEANTSDGTVSLDIENAGETDICEVYIALIDDKAWGDDQLGEKKILAGETFTLTDIPEGEYDMQAL